MAGCDGGITGDRGDATQGGSVLVGLAQPPDSLDPALASSPEALQALWLAYTPPMTYRRAEGAQGTQLMPGLAESKPESLEGATAFRFTLREDLTYSDGRPVLAADVPRAIRRSRALNPAARRALAGIEDIEVDERERTVRIQLRTPDPEFPDLLTTLWTAPVPPGTPTRDLSRTPVAGVGPYRLEARTRGRSYVLTRRRDFRLPGVPAGNADSVAGTVVASRNRRTSQTLAGLLDVTQGEPPAARLPQIRSEYKSRYREFATLTSLYVAFDLDRPPFTDQDVRRAVGFALDLRALGQIQDGFLAPSCNAIPPQVPGYVEIDPCPYGTRDGDPDLVRAEELVRGSRERARAGASWTAAPRRAPPRWPATASRRWRRSASGRALARTARERLRAQMRFDGDHPAACPGRPPTWTWSPTPACAATSARCSATPRRRRHRAGRPWTATWWRGR